MTEAQKHQLAQWLLSLATALEARGRLDQETFAEWIANVPREARDWATALDPEAHTRLHDGQMAADELPGLPPAEGER
jgi:hypothetical protein